MENVAKIRPIPKSEIRKIRHKWELPLFAAVVSVTLVLVAMIVFLLIPFVAEMLTDDVIELRNGLGLIILMIPVLVFFTMGNLYAKTRARAVRVTEKNFPELYHKTEEFAKKLGMKKVPPIYVKQQNGALNAFAAAVIGKPFSNINAEIVDIAYGEHKDFGPAYFVLAHEIAHIYFNHVQFRYFTLVHLGRLIPILGPTFSRAREYSCDRLAQLLTDSEGIEEMSVLLVGRIAYKHIDVRDFISDEINKKGLFIWFFNLQASHPIMPRRLAALADPQRKSGKLIF